MKSLRIHRSIKRDLENLSKDLREELAELFEMLINDQSLGMPVSRPMPTISHGVHELRLKDKSGQVRIFYFTKHASAILVFHIFTKNNQATPKKELEVAKKRLEDLL